MTSVRLPSRCPPRAAHALQRNISSAYTCFYLSTDYACAAPTPYRQSAPWPHVAAGASLLAFVRACVYGVGDGIQHSTEPFCVWRWHLCCHYTRLYDLTTFSGRLFIIWLLCLHPVCWLLLLLMCVYVTERVKIYGVLFAGAMFARTQLCTCGWPEVTCHQQTMSSPNTSCLINNMQGVKFLLIPFLLKFSTFNIAVSLWKYSVDIFGLFLHPIYVKVVWIINYKKKKKCNQIPCTHHQL